MFQHPYLIPQGGSTQLPSFYPDASHYIMHQPQQFQQIYGNGVAHMRNMTFDGASLRGVAPNMVGAQVVSPPSLPAQPVPQKIAVDTPKKEVDPKALKKKNEEEIAKNRKQQWFNAFFMSIIVAATVYLMYAVVG